MRPKILSSTFLLLTFLLTTCGGGTAAPVTQAPVATQPPTGIPTPTLLPTFTPDSLVPFIPVPSLDPKYLPTSPPTPLINQQAIKAWQTQIAIATPVRVPITPSKIETFPKVYIKDGNLYFQSNVGKTIQLTRSGKDRDFIVSDDGQKIAFYRGEKNDNLYFINSDGSQEYAILADETSLLLGMGEITSPTFVPATHILLINTYLCGPRLGLYDGADCTAGVYSIDTDTGKINKIANNLSGSSWKDKNFEISPNGQYVSVAGSGHIDIYALSSGRFILAYPKIIPYYITTPDEFLPKQYWSPNSAELTSVLAADGEYNDPADPPSEYVIFQYTMKNKLTSQIPLDKHIIRGGEWSISPDRNWILFVGNQYGYGSMDWSVYYLGNLNTGQTQAIGGGLHNCQWSPDSKHFVSYDNAIPSFISSVDGSLPIPIDGYFVSWIDNTHYYYVIFENNRVNLAKTYIGEIHDQ